MYAAAYGQMFKYHELNNPGRPGGGMLYIAHPNIQNPFYMTMYGHLSTVDYEFGKPVRRGERLGSVIQTDIAKLMMIRYNNWVDPDNYGINHSYMNYWDQKTDLDIHKEAEVNMFREGQQRDILKILLQNSSEEVRNKIFRRKHRVKKDQPCNWDIPEEFRYLNKLYEKVCSRGTQNKYFSGKISNEQMNEMEKEFVANQPIILSFPLV
jgi:hypothetical protein